MDTKTEKAAENINDRAKIKDFINDKLERCTNINDKYSITDDVVDKLVDICCYLESNQTSKSDAIAKTISMSSSRTREYLQAFVALDIVVPEGGNKNRKYRLKAK